MHAQNRGISLNKTGNQQKKGFAREKQGISSAKERTS
jgi:hypothetical protein